MHPLWFLRKWFWIGLAWFSPSEVQAGGGSMRGTLVYEPRERDVDVQRHGFLDQVGERVEREGSLPGVLRLVEPEFLVDDQLDRHRAAEGTPEEVKASPDPYVKHFLSMWFAKQ